MQLTFIDFLFGSTPVTLAMVGFAIAGCVPSYYAVRAVDRRLSSKGPAMKFTGVAGAALLAGYLIFLFVGQGIHIQGIKNLHAMYEKAPQLSAQVIAHNEKNPENKVRLSNAFKLLMDIHKLPASTSKDFALKLVRRARYERGSHGVETTEVLPLHQFLAHRDRLNDCMREPGYDINFTFPTTEQRMNQYISKRYVEFGSDIVDPYCADLNKEY